MENANISRGSGAESPERLAPQETWVARALLVDVGQVLVELDRAWAAGACGVILTPPSCVLSREDR
jgi:hypothetical protein